MINLFYSLEPPHPSHGRVTRNECKTPPEAEMVIYKDQHVIYYWMDQIKLELCSPELVTDWITHYYE